MAVTAMPLGVRRAKVEAPARPADDREWLATVQRWQAAKTARKESEADEKRAAEELRAELVARGGVGAMIETTAGACTLIPGGRLMPAREERREAWETLTHIPPRSAR